MEEEYWGWQIKPRDEKYFIPAINSVKQESEDTLRARMTLNVQENCKET